MNVFLIAKNVIAHENVYIKIVANLQISLAFKNRCHYLLRKSFIQEIESVLQRHFHVV